MSYKRDMKQFPQLIKKGGKRYILHKGKAYQIKTSLSDHEVILHIVQIAQDIDKRKFKKRRKKRKKKTVDAKPPEISASSVQKLRRNRGPASSSADIKQTW